MKTRRRTRMLALMLCLALALGLVMGLGAAAQTSTPQVVVLQLGSNKMVVGAQVTQVDPQNARVVPISENGRTLVPVSRIVDAFGGKSAWNGATRTATFTLGGKTVTHTVGQKTIQANGRTVTMEVPSRIIQDRTYVPARYVLEGLGLHVGWDPTDRLVAVSTDDLAGVDVGSLSQSMRLSGRLGDLSAIGVRPCVPDLMAYFGLEERDYAVAPAENYHSGGAGGKAVTADAQRVSGSDGVLLDGFLSVMEEFGFQFTQVDAVEQDTARFGVYSQSLYFRYDGPGREKVVHLGDRDGATYDFVLCYTNYYRANGASRDHTSIEYTAAAGLEVLPVGVTDGDWNVAPARTEALPSRPSTTTVYLRNGRANYAPDPLAYFGLAAGQFTQKAVTNGTRYEAKLELVSGSDDRFLNDFIQIMQEQGFSFAHVGTNIQDTARFGVYAQDFYFRYTGPESGAIAHLGQWEGKDYDLMLSYGNYYAANGASRNRTGLDVEVCSAIALVDTGTRDSRWNVKVQAAPGTGTGTGTGTGSGGGTGTGATTPTRPGGVSCAVCHGDGKRDCLSCSGRGYFERRKSTPNYSGKGPKYYTVKENCGACRGTGKKTCTYCGGDGKVGT